MKNYIIAALAGMLSTSTVLAADLPHYAPVYDVAPVYDWTGFYAGINGGYSRGTVASTSVGDVDVDGGILGAQIGYNYDLGGFVLGAEADVQWSGVDGGITAPLGTEVTGSLDYFGTVRLRAGAAIDRFMPYVTGGFAFGRVGVTTTSLGGMSSDKDAAGYTVGAGIEYAMTDNITVKGEYLYTDFGDQTFFSGTAVEETDQVAFHTVRAGINFKF